MKSCIANRKRWLRKVARKDVDSSNRTPWNAKRLQAMHSWVGITKICKSGENRNMSVTQNTTSNYS